MKAALICVRAAPDANVGLIEHDVAGATSSVNSDTADGQIKLGSL